MATVHKCGRQRNTDNMKNILVATDFTKSSLSAVNYAANIALATGSRLILLHATHIPVVSDSFFDMGFTLDEMQKADREKMARLHSDLQKKFPDLKMEKQVKIGFTGELIREMVRKGDVGLVIMGISHVDKFSQVVFGSTSTAIAGLLNCPVLIIPEGARYREWKKIGFTFDQKNLPTGTGVRVLKELVDAYGAELHYVNVLDQQPFTEKDTTSLNPVFKIFKDEQPHVHFLNYIPNKTVDIIQDWARRYKANALVMVARQHNLLWKMFNERTTKKMAFSTSVPLLILSESKKH